MSTVLRYALMLKCSTSDKRGQGTIEAHKSPRGGGRLDKREA